MDSSRRGGAVGNKRPEVSQELIFLDPDDDLASVLAKLESKDVEQIFLAIPRGVPILRTPLEFRMLGRVAAQLSSETIVVTSDSNRRWLAKREGFRTASSLRSVAHLFPSEQRSFGHVARGFARHAPLALAGLLLGTLAALGYFILPVLHVTLTPATVSVARELEFTVDTTAAGPDPARRVIPGRVVSERIQAVASVAATGIRTVGRERSRGEVAMTNTGESEIILPRATRLMSGSGAFFLTDSGVRLPANPVTSVRVGVIAAEPGSYGNLPPGSVLGLENRDHPIIVTQQRPTAGGEDREVRAVAEEDRARLRDQLLKQASDQALSLLGARVSRSQAIVPNSVHIEREAESFDKDPGAEGERLTGRLAATVSALVYTPEDTTSIALQSIRSALDSDQQLVGSVRLGSVEAIRRDGPNAHMTISYTGSLVRRLDASAVAAEVRGKSRTEAQEVLSQLGGLASVPRVEIWPEWAGRAFRVQVEVVQTQ